MAIGHVNTQLASSTGATSITLTKPTGLAEGNLMLAAFCIESASDLVNSVPSGFTLLRKSVIGTRTHNLYIYFKIATASDASASNFVWGFSSSIENAGFLSAWSGIKTSAPIGDFSVSSANASSANAVCPVTYVRANNVSLCIASSMYGTTWTAPTGTTPTYTEIADRLSAASSSGLSIHASWGTLASTGLMPTKTCVAAVADYWKAVNIEIVDASYTEEIPEIFTPLAPHALVLNQSHPHAQAILWAHVFTTVGASGKAVDMTYNDDVSTIVGGAAVDSSGYLVLDGSNDAVKFPTILGTLFNQARSSFAVGFRYRGPRTDGSYSQIFMACSSTATYPKLALTVSTSNALSLTIIGTTSSNWYSVIVHEPLVPGRWYHIYVSQDGSKPRIYINGKFVAQNGAIGGSGTAAYWFSQVTGTIYYCLGAWWTSTTYDYANIDLAYFYYWDDEGQYAGQSGFPAVFAQDPYAMFRPQRQDWLKKLIQGATLLQAADLAHAHGLEDAGALTQKHTLAVDELAHGNALDDAGALTQKHLLAVAELAHGHALDDAGTLVEKHLLAVADLGHAHGLEDAGTLAQKHTLAVDELAHGHALDAADLVLASVTLQVADLGHAHALDDAGALAQKHTLAVAELAHGHALDDAGTLVENHLLQAADLAHAHGLEGAGALAQKHLLAVAELAHAHALDAADLSSASTLQVADLSHAHGLEAAGTLAQKHTLAVAALAHGHQLDAADLAQRHTLLAAGLLHGHGLDSIILVTAVGRVMVALSAARPQIAFAAVVPEVAFESVAPGIGFSAVKPEAAFTAVRPAVDFTATN
jgi:hypothetical protein